MRVLVIDDEPDLLSSVEHVLRRAGHDVVAIADAKKDLPALVIREFDALLTDVLMPDMDGIEVIRALRQSHPKLWIVAMSGGSQQTPAAYGITLSQAFGADKVLYKPFSNGDLLKALDRS